MLGVSPILPLPAPPTDGDLGPMPPQVTEQSQDERKETEDQNNASQSQSALPSVATHTRTIGIIHPPPDIRNIVVTTAQFVAKNGVKFVRRIIADNAGNVKFNFLNASDPYHAYYQHHLSESRAQIQTAGQQPSLPPAESAASEPALARVASEEKPDPAAQFRPVRKVLEPPEAEQYTVRLPEGITSEELDIIKLTAQFVARNGKSFLTGLTSREGNNPQFHFLKPTLSMFTFFTALADAYSKVLMPPKGLKGKLRKSVADWSTALERCLHRLEWEKSQVQARQKAEDEIERERIQMAMIDWHDFVVVESVDFADDEDNELPVPMTLEEVIRSSKVSIVEEEIVEPGLEVEMEMDEEEMQLVEEGMRTASIEENGDDQKYEVKVTMDEDEAPMRIVRWYKRAEERIPAERDPTKYVVSPITGELIPISEMSEHIRISLIDPKYKEQKDKMFAKIRDTTLANDEEITKNIVGLARTRPDIFGTTEEEVSNAVKAEIEKTVDEQPKQVIWDGHTGSIGHTANQAMSHSTGGEDHNDAANFDGRPLPGPAAPPPSKAGIPSSRPLPPPPGLALNIPHAPPGPIQYSAATNVGVLMPPPPRPSIHVNPMVRSPPPQMPMSSGQQLMMMCRPPPMPPSMSMNPPSIPVPLTPGSQFTPVGVRPFGSVPIPQPSMPMVPPPPLPQGMPPPPPEEAPPPLPEEPEPKRQKVENSMLIPEEQFVAQHLGPVCINVSVPNLGNLKGQVLEITVQSVSETVGSLKEKVSAEIQLPANKQKLSGKAGFLKDNLSLAYYNVGAGESLILSLRERGGRKR